jgi:glycosyltransferase involved in cell wall biosynthesis
VEGPDSAVASSDVRVIFIADVRQVGHQVEAARSLGLSTTHHGLRVFDQKHVDALRRFPPLRPVANRVNQRVGSQFGTVPDYTLGVSEYLPTLFAAVGAGNSRMAAELPKTLARRSLRSIKIGHHQVTLIHFTEGLGRREWFDERAGVTTVLERRGMPPAALEVSDPVGGFPRGTMSRMYFGRNLAFEDEHSDHVIVYSDTARGAFADIGIPIGKIHVVPLWSTPSLPFTSDEVESSSSSRDFIFVGRCTAAKGLDVAVASAQLVEGARLHVVGSASPDVARWLTVQPGVTYHGVLSRSGIRALMPDMAALVMPSVESFGLAVLEAASAGLPVIVRDTVGAATVFQSEMPASTVVGRDPQKWASRMSSHLNSSMAARAMSSAVVRLCAAQYSPQRSLEAQRGVYDKILRIGKS